MLKTIKNKLSIFDEFVKLESFGSLLLIVATILALLICNLGGLHFYETLLHHTFSLQIGTVHIQVESLEFWINDGLMTIFFFIIGMELKREMLEGHLRHWSLVVLPTIGAIGGMAVPALIYLAFNWNNPATLNGWAIPSATDIAFSLGILMLLGKRVPLSLKLFLMTLAIIDDLGAIVIIALFYTEELHLIYLAFAVMILPLPKILFYGKRITNITVYFVIGLLLWFFILKSGVHASIAGVALAFFIPSVRDSYKDRRLLEEFEKALHPWVAYAILPLFAFANAGVSFEGMNLSVLLEPVPLGIMLGLLIGKQIGVFGFIWLAVKLGLATLDEKTTWGTLYGVSLLCGIGFTMSFFIGGLAFADPEYMSQIRISVLIGSLLSGVLGYFILLMATTGQVHSNDLE